MKPRGNEENHAIKNLQYSGCKYQYYYDAAD